jgi:hypothetical protein
VTPARVADTPIAVQKDAECGCDRGNLLARWRDGGLELKCRRCKRRVIKLTVLVGVNRFLTGRFFQQAAGSRRDIDYGYVQATLEF